MTLLLALRISSPRWSGLPGSFGSGPSKFFPFLFDRRSCFVQNRIPRQKRVLVMSSSTVTDRRRRSRSTHRVMPTGERSRMFKRSMSSQTGGHVRGRRCEGRDSGIGNVNTRDEVAVLVVAIPAGLPQVAPKSRTCFGRRLTLNVGLWTKTSPTLCTERR
jgi:hypothetical protein